VYEVTTPKREYRAVPKSMNASDACMILMVRTVCGIKRQREG
jgi:hypothetical protein